MHIYTYKYINKYMYTYTQRYMYLYIYTYIILYTYIDIKHIYNFSVFYGLGIIALVIVVFASRDTLLKCVC